MSLSPAPTDPTNRRAWVRWADELRRFVTSSGALAWSQVSKTGSNLQDLETRSHTDLSAIGTNSHAQIDTHIAAPNPHTGTASASALSDHTGATTAHGATGDLVGVGNTATATVAGVVLAGTPVADLAQTVSATPTQAEVQAISNKVDELLAALRTAGILEI